MEQTREINATLTNEEIKQVDAGVSTNQPDGKKVDKAEIINLISQLPVKERMDIIRDLQTAASHDADLFSVGKDADASQYDTLRDGYQKKAKGAENKEQPKETK